jgi:hypothetical protein
MAGERYASITIQAHLSHHDYNRGLETASLTFTLAGQPITLRRGGGPGEYAVPDPDEAGVGEAYVLQCVQNVLTQLNGRIFARALPYVVSAPRQLTTTIQDPYNASAQVPVVEFDITATDYSQGVDLTPGFAYPDSGWSIAQLVANISPVFATATVTPAGIFGTATGAITITASRGSYPAPGSFLYTWDDGGHGATRTNLKAGKYGCTVRDLSTVASVTLEIEVKQDPQLQVEVTTTPNSITLVISGGVAPYTIVWADGATSAVRTGLPEATYHYLVTDAHGAQVEGDVTLSSNNRYWFSGNPVTLSLDAGPDYRADPTTKPGLSFVCQVWVEPVYLSGDFVQVGQELEQPADAAGRTSFEVQELLEPFVAPVLPAVGQADVQRVDGAFRRFYLKHFERTTTGDGALKTVDTNYLLHGGLDYWEAAVGTWFTSWQTARMPFLSWEPTTKKVLPDQPEYLYFMVPKVNVASFQVHLGLAWADGTSTDVVLATRIEVRRYEVFCLPTGPGPLDIATREASAGKRVLSYTLDVRDETGQPLSETRTYLLDRKPCPVRRYFLYANSLGGWNTLVCRGRLSLDVATKTTASENARAAGYDPLRGDYTTNRRTGQPTLHCYTGARSAEQLIADRDFMLSERVLLLDAGRYLAGQVKDRTFTPYDEDETRRVVQFDYDLPRERFYTPHLVL